MKNKLFYGCAAALLLLGIFCVFVYTPIRFTGYLCFCAAGAVVIFALLTGWSKTRPWARWARRVLLVLLAAGLAFFAAMEAWVVSWARTDEAADVSAVVVLGAGVNGTQPSLSLSVRLNAALDYVSDRPGIPIVVSGAQGPGEDITEAQCMANWLTGHDVAAERIWLEERATDTEENIAFSKALLAERGVDLTDNIAVVTSDYHLCRAARLWGTPGMVPVAAYMPARYFPLTANYYVREAFAMAAELLF